MSDLLKRLDDAAPYARGYGFAARCVEAAARIRELEAQLAAPLAVKVKPLDWKKTGHFYIASDPLFSIAAVSTKPSEYDTERAARILAAIEAVPVPVAEVWRRAIEAAAMVAGVGTFPITERYDDLTPAAQARANECARIQNAIRALPMPDDLGVRHE